MIESGRSEQPPATVRELDGKLVLDDPDALAFMRAVSKKNCTVTLETQMDRVEYFKGRLTDGGLSPDELVITIIHVDDPNGSVLAERLMPGCDWQVYRDRGERPIARGLTGTEGIQAFLDATDEEAATKLRETTGPAVVVVDHGVAEVFPA